MCDDYDHDDHDTSSDFLGSSLVLLSCDSATRIVAFARAFTVPRPASINIDNPTPFTIAMDAKEIELRGKAIAKAVQEGEPSASILKLLNDLKAGVHATEDLLRSTRIGVTINRLRQHKDPAVQKLATELVSKWRDEVKKKQPPKKDGVAKVAANGGAASSPAPPPSGTSSPAPIQAKKKHDVPAEKRNHKTDNVKYQVTGNEARDNCVRLMYDGLAYMSEASQ